jgi:hypothetical protein
VSAISDSPQCAVKIVENIIGIFEPDVALHKSRVLDVARQARH